MSTIFPMASAFVIGDAGGAAPKMAAFNISSPSPAELAERALPPPGFWRLPPLRDLSVMSSSQ
jgi:hypothetical protein